MGRAIKTTLALLLIGAPPLFALLGSGLTRLDQEQEHLEQLRVRNVRLQARNQEKRERIAALESDLRFLEKTARAELGWIREGETVYRVPAPPPPPPRQKAEQ